MSRDGCGAYVIWEMSDIRLAQITKARMSPVAHRNTHGVLVHGEVPILREMQAALPRITKPVWPFSRIAIPFVPNIFLGPEPTLSSHAENGVDHIRVSFAINRSEERRVGKECRSRW